MSLHKLTWASALPSDLGKAMREASERRMATDTDSHVFLFPITLSARGSRQTVITHTAMKKLLLVLMALLCQVLAFAQGGQVATLLHGDELKTFYSATAFTDALANAQAGDVITLSAGSFKGGSIKVPVTVRGAGIGSLDSLDNASTARTIISGNISINIPENTDGHSLSMEGLLCEEDVRVQAVNPIFAKMRICGSFKYYGNDYDKAVMDNVTIFHCIIDGTMNLSSSATVIAYNSVISGNISWGSIVDLNNSIFKSYTTNTAVKLNNSIIDLTKSTYKNIYNVTCYNCLGVGCSKFDGSNNNEDRNNRLFPSESKAFKDGTFYRLTDEAAAYLGSDNTQVGIYGTSLPFSVKTSYPQLKKFSVAPESTADGKLKIEIEIDAD